ncbi:hypothetical protein COBT_002996 [Conglomerata obtusa]
MFRCSLFSTTNETEELFTTLKLLNFAKREYQRHELVYTNSKRNRLVLNESDKSLIVWDSPDTSKDRVTICSKYERTKILDFDKNFDFSRFGYEFVKEVRANVCEFVRGNIVIEVVTDDDDIFFVHAFILTTSPGEDEKILKRSCDEMKDVLEFVKPPIQSLYM